MSAAHSHDDHIGYWGPKTSTMDFCEPNYEHSHYVAELYNTITSIPIFLVGLSGVLLSKSQRLGREQTLCYTMVAIVGIGSVAFHATLLRTGQVLDEVPMLWATLTLIYAAYQHRGDRRRRRAMGLVPTSKRLTLVGACLIVYAAIATILYFQTGFLTFVVAYGASVVVLIGLASTILFTETPPVGPDPKRLLLTAACTYAGGFVLLWAPGEILCHSVPIVKRLPLHALFHLTSAAGPHLGLTAFACARFDGEKNVRTPSSWRFGGLPAIERGAVERMEKAL